MPKRVDPPATVPLVILTDAETGRKVAMNSGWMTSFREGENGTTVFKLMSGDTLTVSEDFCTVAETFAARRR